MTRPTAKTGATPASTAKQYLTFTIDDEEYAVDIARVQEIRAFMPITPIPTAPEYVKGVLNLRGMISPVIGLRERFGLPGRLYDKFSVILVVVVASKAIGLIVDRVADVITVDETLVKAVPDLGARIDTSFMLGVVAVGEKLAIILDVERIVGEHVERETQGAVNAA